MILSYDKKPRKVLVLGHEVRVRYRKKYPHFGEFFSDDNEIFIRNDEKWREHLLHEILHAIFFYSGHTEKFEGNEEEALVRALENGLKSLGFFN